jgi:1-deoxy-D-xylulose 5-phosphate reductoisomerase
VPCDFCAADEVLVEAFLLERIPFTAIPIFLEKVLATLAPVDLPDVDAVEARHGQVRRRTEEEIAAA